MPTADQVHLTLQSDANVWQSHANVRHGSSKQHAAEQSVQPSRLLQAFGVQSQTAAAPWGKVALKDFKRLDSSDSTGAKRPSSAASGLHEQMHLSHDKAKHRPAAQRDKIPTDVSRDLSRHASQDNSRERKHSSSREHAHDQPSHWRDASTDRHDKSHRDDGSRDRHDRTQDRHSRLSDNHGRSSHRQYRSDDRHDSKSVSRLQDASGDRHEGTKHVHGQQVSFQSRGQSEKHVGNRKEQQQYASRQDRYRADQHKRKRSTSPPSGKYIANKRLTGI